jgi:two-component system, chemotaxis family, sensor kinase CheA
MPKESSVTRDREMAEIAKVFFQECREGLDAMESGLLGLGADTDRENINTIFRAAHSIKGGAATFGFTEVEAFTHGVETLLDEMRSEVRPVTAEVIQALLQACDCMREMVAATEAEQPLDQGRIVSLKSDISRILGEPSAAKPAAPVAAPAETAGRTQVGGWRIAFEPVADLLRLRNEPTRMFGELERLGTVVAHTDVSRLPALEALDPESCYLAWDLEVTGEIPRAALDEIFDWVDTRCRLEFIPLQAEKICAAVLPSARAEAGAPPLNAAYKGSAESGSIRVATQKLDNIINLVGELLITQSMLCGFAEGIGPGDPDRLRQGLSQLARNTRELQESVMQIRMLPISFVFNRFPRIVHDLSRKLGKKVEIKLIGEGTELDKTVLEKIADPLVHLVRNALDHGLETPEQRAAAGKHEFGTVELAAYHEGGNIIIEVRDDGAGLNKTKILQKARERGLVPSDQELTDDAINNLIFMPGFSTADQISDVSGRGVGMDVVRRNIVDLGGHVQIFAKEGQGSTIRIRLPLTLAILDGQLVRVGKEIYIISLLAIVETIQLGPEHLNTRVGRTEVFRLREEYLPVIKLCDQFGIEPDSRSVEDGLLVVVEADGKRVGVLVDDLLAQQQVVIKSLESNFKSVAGIAGATILGDGAVALIIDVPDLIHSSAELRRGATARAA